MENKSLFFISGIFLSLILSLIIVSAIPSEVVAFWKFEDNGLVIKDSARLNDGVIVKGAEVPGKVNNALQLNGSGFYASVPDSTDLRLKNSFSIEAWIYPKAYNYGVPIVTKTASFWPNNYYEFYVHSSGKLAFWYGDNCRHNGEICTGSNPWVWGMSSNTIKLNEWTFVAVTFDQNTKTITYYINGNKDSFSVDSRYIMNPNYQSFPLYIGSDADPYDAFNGKIDEVAIWNKALNASEIQKHYNNSDGGKDYFFSVPVISNVNVTGITNSSAAITWNTDLSSDSYVEYGTNINNLSMNVLNSSLTLSHSVSLNGLAPNTTYYYSVNSCIDPNDDATCSPFSNTLSFTTLANPVIPPIDTNPPSIVGNINVAVTNSSASMSFNTNKQSNSTINYGTTFSLGTILSNPAFSTSQSILLSSLLANTTYFYNLTLCNNLSNCTTFGTFNFTTLANNIIPPTDTTPPGAITNFNYTATNSSISMSWTNPSDLDFNGTLILLNGTQIAVLNKSIISYKINNLIENKTYNITIITIDNSGNQNSSTFSAATTIGNQTTPPIIPPINPPVNPPVVHHTTHKTVIGQAAAETETTPEIRYRGESIGTLELTPSQKQPASNYIVFVLLLALASLFLILVIFILIYAKRKG